MIRKLLATTAITLVATTAAWSAETKPQAMAPAMTQEGYLQSIGHAQLASTLIGETVYESDAADAQSVGDINDLVVGEDGTVEAVVIGIGGFLGVGEKDVAVDFNKIHWSQDKNGNNVVVFEASKESLQNAPEFVPPEENTAMAPATGTMAPSSNATATSSNMTAADKPMGSTDSTSTNTAMAPAGQQTATATDQSTAAGLTDVDVGSLSADQLIGATVYSSDDKDIGEVGDVRLAADGGKVDAMIVDVGGFLGLGQKPVAIGFDNLKIRKDHGGKYYVYTDFTRDELNSAPDYDKATYDAQRDTMRLTMRSGK